jgi:hypothetical protein
LTTVDCAALQAELDAARAQLAAMRGQSGIRMVADSDGSRIEYNNQGLAGQESYVRRLESQFATFCGNCIRASGPIGYVFP